MDSIPRIVEQAVRISMSGRPGAVYIDLPANLIAAIGPEPAYLSMFELTSAPQAQPG